MFHMSTTETVKELKDQLTSSHSSAQNALVAGVADASKAVKGAKAAYKEAKEAANAAKEAAKASKVAQEAAKAGHEAAQAKLEGSYTAAQKTLKTKLADAQRALMASRMGK